MQKLCKFAQIIFRSWILHNWMVGLLKRKISWFITALIPQTVGTGPNAPVIAYLYKMAKTSSHIFFANLKLQDWTIILRSILFGYAKKLKKLVHIFVKYELAYIKSFPKMYNLSYLSLKQWICWPLSLSWERVRNLQQYSQNKIGRQNSGIAKTRDIFI